MSKYPTTPMCDGALLEMFEPTTRPTDVFCATAAKSGQTWLLTLMHHLRTRGRDPDLGDKTLLDVCPWLELPRDFRRPDRPLIDRAERMAELEALPDPRVFKLHVVWEEIPRAAGSGAKVVTITRDPRELPYSMYSHLRGLKDEVGANVGDDFDAYFERWFEFGYVYKLAASFWPHRNDPDVLWLRYEDMQRDLRGSARRLVEFLGWDVPDDDIERVLPLVGFERMRDRERNGLMGRGETSMWKDGARFFREGAVGKNRARLSSEQEARIIARARETLPEACVELLFSLPPR
jgi:hypothetical protein